MENVIGFGRGVAPQAQIRDSEFLHQASLEPLFIKKSRCEDLFTPKQVFHLVGASLSGIQIRKPSALLAPRHGNRTAHEL